METTINLPDAPLGSNCLVKSIGGSGAMKHRLMDLGLLEDTIISPLFESLSGDPRAYNLRGAVIALRNKDAKQIKVVPR